MIDAINRRRSVRNYSPKPLSTEDQSWIRATLQRYEQLKGPFNHQFKFFYFNNEEGKPDEALQIGTYGFIKNAPAFFGGTAPNNELAIIDYGYIFESLILEMTGHHLGTVWLGGTFQRYKLSHLITEGNIIPAISAVGYPAEKMGLREKFTRFGIAADQRKPFDELFSQDHWGQPLSSDHPFQNILQLVRIGPSGTNQQPWRILVQGNSLHLYLKPTPNYAKGFPFEMQLLDMGIALCHLEVGLNQEGLQYTYVDKIPTPLPDMRYIITLQVDNKK